MRAPASLRAGRAHLSGERPACVVATETVCPPVISSHLRKQNRQSDLCREHAARVVTA